MISGPFLFHGNSKQKPDNLGFTWFRFDLDLKRRTAVGFVSLRETDTSGAKNRNRFDFFGFDLYPKTTDMGFFMS